jgi:CBS domain containing-hemolysin-like protein|tara:strand:- start:1769 stop:3415 length:1647 start_codon:yes stop_codon:yes gene_type:complete
MQQWFEAISGQWQALGAFFAFDAALLIEPSMVLRLVLLAVLLFCSAFFSGSETALFSLSRLDLQQLRRERNPHSETLHALLDQPRRLIISILTGNELINIAATVNAAGILVILYGDARAGWISIIVMVPLVLLFGEVTPKTIAVSNPVRFSTTVVAGPMSLWVRLVSPLRNVIRLVSDKLTTRIVGEQATAESLLNVDEFLTLVEQVAQGGELDATERALINNLLEANETEIVEIMTPRTRMDFLNAEMPLREMIDKFRKYQHTRVPIFRVHRDNLVGFLHAEDVLQLLSDSVDISDLTPEEIVHPPVVVPLTKKVDEMFDFFRENGVRAAVCLNEFGGVEGFITIYDVLTFIFGDISGESHGQALYHERDLNIYELPGEMKLTDVNNLTHFGLEDPRMTTIGGVAFRHLDRLPRVGDRVVIDDIALTVLDMDAHRISKVRVAKVSAEEDLEEMSETKRAEIEQAQVAAMVSEQADKEFDLATGVEVAGTDEAAVEPADHEGQVSATSGQLGAAVTDNGKEDAGSRPVSGAPSIQEPRDGDPDIRMMN